MSCTNALIPVSITYCGQLKLEMFANNPKKDNISFWYHYVIHLV